MFSSAEHAGLISSRYLGAPPVINNISSLYTKIKNIAFCVNLSGREFNTKSQNTNFRVFYDKESFAKHKIRTGKTISESIYRHEKGMPGVKISTFPEPDTKILSLPA